VSSNKRRICVVVTARPTYSRIRTALAAINERDDLELQLVVAASALLSRYGLAVEQIERDGFEVTARAQTVVEGEDHGSMAKTTGLSILELTTVLQNLRPDAVVTVADRYETMATAVAAAYLHRPLVHIQGGEVTGTIDEKVRHAVTKLADLHLVSTELAAERVIRMGEVPETVHVTGCPSIDLAAEVQRAPALDFDPYERYGGVGHAPAIDGGYVVAMQHPVTFEADEARAQVTATLEALDEIGLPVLWFWPNVDAGSDGTSAGIRHFRERHQGERFHFFKNTAPMDFLRLLVNARALVGNSSVGIRECSFLGVPVVDIGARQFGRERGPNVIQVDHDRDAIVAAVRAQLAHGPYRSEPLYGDGKAGLRIAERLATVPLTVEKRLAY
jgi:UDP-hydrolysing UDP-N-acetyl-D-glucosamine 2-epimerase